MPIPQYLKMYPSFLKSLSDGAEHPLSDAKQQALADFGLTEEDLKEMLDSGRQSVFNNRIGWCRTYLKKAGLIESPSRARFIITEEGKKVLESGEEITNELLMRYPSFREFFNGKPSENTDHAEAETREEDSEETPEEAMDRLQKKMYQLLQDELLQKIHSNTPAFFERMVVELMEKMGYGWGKVTQSSRDEGIDGLIYQDKLGFDVIYVQAKRYDPEKKVGRPELQAFGGAIPEKSAKGLFVTTGRFTADAIQYAEKRHIILIDGQRLTELMIEHDYGVTTEYTYKLKRMDTDCFEEE